MASAEATEVSELNGVVPEAKLLHTIDLIEVRTGNVVKGAEALKGKVTAVAIGPHWFPIPLRQTLASFSEHIDQLKDEGKPIAFVYVAVDRDETFIRGLKARGQSTFVDERPDLECFDDLRKQLAEDWLAVPFEDSASRAALVNHLRAGLFSLAFVGENGETLTKDGMEILEKWGADAYPFTSERFDELEKEAKERTAKQSLNSLLVTAERDYVIKNDGSQVKVESLEGKIVALYFSAHWCGPCRRFTPVLADIYNKLKSKNEDFEVVFISSDKDDVAFEEYHREMPWLAVPFPDSKTKKLLNRWFDVEGFPTLVVLDKHGKTMTAEGVERVYKHGLDAYPFTPERMAELKAEEDAKRAAQTLDSLLVTESRDFVISHDDKEVKISEIKGKTVGLYFSAHWCPPCRGFTPKLIEVYNELKKKAAEFEIIFISSDQDEEAFKSYYGSMPWLALPFSDRESKSTLSSYFEVQGIPSLVIIGPDGRTVTADGRGLVGQFGSKGCPFTDAHIASLQEKLNAETAKLPKEINHSSHPEHPLVLVADAYEGRSYGCDLCEEDGSGWVYHCDKCCYDLHPHCAKSEAENGEPGAEADATTEGSRDTEGKEGWVCEGDACKKV